MLKKGVYDVSDGELSLSYRVTLEAEEAMTVALDAKGANRVIYVDGTGVELVGLNITGGYAGVSVTHFEPLEPSSSAPFMHVLTLCAVLHAVGWCSLLN